MTPAGLAIRLVVRASGLVFPLKYKTFIVLNCGNDAFVNPQKDSRVQRSIDSQNSRDARVTGTGASAQKRARKRAQGRKALVGLAAFAVLIGGSVTACGDNSASPGVVKEAGASEGVVEGLGAVATGLLEGLGEGAGLQAYEFLMREIEGPDPTTKSLSDIKDQLNGISAQMDQVQASLVDVKHQLSEQDRVEAIKDLIGFNDDITTLYTDYFLPIADAAIAVQQAKDSGGDVAAATQTLTDRKDEFKAAYLAKSADEVSLKQHQYLMPNNDFPSVLKVTGQVLMDKGYLTAYDSTQLHNLYLAIADQEALATTMVLEHDLMTNNQAAFARHSDVYKKAHAAEVQNLPPAIPVGYVIDTRNGTTANAQTFMAPVKGGDDFMGYPKFNWLPVAWNGQLGGDPMAPILADNPGWKVPSNGDIKALAQATAKAPERYTGSDPQVPAGSVANRLTSLWMLDAIPGTTNDLINGADSQMNRWMRDWVWTSDQSYSNATQCWMGQIEGGNELRTDITYFMHNAANLKGATATFEAHPGTLGAELPDAYSDNGNGSNPGECQRYVVDQLQGQPGNQAGVFLTKVSNEDYMAQSTALR